MTETTANQDSPPRKTSMTEVKADPFTAGVLLGLAGFDVSEMLELKAGPPGATFPSPDPGAARLRKYWTRGPGAAKIKWGEKGDFDRCVTHMREHVGERAEGLCNIYHRSAIGVAPGQEHKSEVAALWIPDESAPGGWRADPSAWSLETKEIDVVERTDDKVMADLDRYEGMEGDVEKAYEDAIAADIQWDLQPDGELVDPETGAESGDAGDVAPSLFGDVEDES